MKIKILSATLACLFVISVGCANQPATIHKVVDSTYIVDYNASRRAAYVRLLAGNGKNPDTVICAEPAPDVAVSLTADLEAHLKSVLEKAADIEARAKISEAIIDLARRGQTLQIQREALYRLCELQANTGLNAEQALELYREVLKAIQAIAYAELANSALPEETKKDLLKNIIKGDILKPK